MSLTQAQRAFVTSREPFPAFVGGFGSGKTAAGIARALALKTHFPEQDVAYYLPTFPLVEDIALRRFPELCERKGWSYKLRSGNSPQIAFPGKGRIVFRTMEQPSRIVGYEVAHSVIDELDTLPIEKAREAWNKIIARNRQKLPGDFPNTVGVVTTPEGFRFVWERWVKNKAPGYVLFRARTMDNVAHLPPGYIENLQGTYSSQLLAAYLEGEYGLRGLYVGVPVQIGSGGVEKVYEIDLTDDEKKALAVSASHVKELVEATAKVLAAGDKPA